MRFGHHLNYAAEEFVVRGSAKGLRPGSFRAPIQAFVPSELSGSLIGWRLLGLVRIAISAPFVYFGGLAL